LLFIVNTFGTPGRADGGETTGGAGVLGGTAEVGLGAVVAAHPESKKATLIKAVRRYLRNGDINRYPEI